MLTDNHFKKNNHIILYLIFIRIYFIFDNIILLNNSYNFSIDINNHCLFTFHYKNFKNNK